MQPAGVWLLANHCGGQGGGGHAGTRSRGAQVDHGRLDAGFTLFDHADIYSDGLGEWVFGRVLKANKGLRDKILIAFEVRHSQSGRSHSERSVPLRLHSRAYPEFVRSVAEAIADRPH